MSDLMPLVGCDHDNITPTSQCCGAPNYFGVCAQCHERTGWFQYCEVCDTEFPVEFDELRPV